ncbi:hypothetical protein COO60DRAFT_1697167 [Scenedesmus sp. NREL 46B-D3]|nr:hypothetical protein COO60DRAFT_1697167 [Scenedesmus sp. NREL 46B-D3]
MGKEEMVLEWVLNGLIGDESGATDSQLEVLLSHLDGSAVLRSCEAAVKPQLQKFLTTLILSPISSNSDLHQHCYTLIYQLYQAVPQVLLPVIPHMTSEMLAEDAAKRAEATQLLVCEYVDVFDELLHRFKDAEVGIRLHLVEFAPTLVAAAGSSERQEKVVREAAVRLQDYDDKVRIAAVKAVCQCARQLLAGPAGAASGGTAATACHPHQLGLLAPPAVVTLLDSQEQDEAAAAELGVAYTPPEKQLDFGVGGADAAAGVAAGARDVAWLQDVLKGMCMRLRDTKTSVRKQTANSLMAVFRTVAAAGTGEQLAKYCWLPARMLLCCKTDVELRAHLIEAVMKDGLLGAQAVPAQAAAAWVQLWLNANPMDRETLMMMLAMRARLQGDALAFLVLRRKLSGKARDPEAAEPIKQDVERAARSLASSLAPFTPNTSKAAEGLAALQAVRDNHVFAALQQALTPGASAQAFSKARADALSRLAGGDLEGEQADLVRGAFQLAQRLSKYAPMLFAGLLPQLHSLLQGSEPDLQQLAAQLLALCAKEQRKRGMLLAASPDAAVAKLVKQQLLPYMRQLAQGRSSAAAAGGRQSRKRKQPADADDAADPMDEDDADAADAEEELGGSQAAAAAVCNPRAAKWATYAIAYSQDHSRARAELSRLAADLAGSLDSGEPESAAKLQALSTIGRLLPGDVISYCTIADVFSQHAEQLLSFVLDDYLLTYLDAAVTAPAGAAAGGSGRSQPSLSTPASLASPGSSRGRYSSQLGTAGGSSQVEAAGVWLKGAALKALAAGCVPDSDSDDVPVETQRMAARLAQDLEGLLEPSEEARPQFLADAPDELAGQLRLAAAASLLRLARRHDSRLGAGCYCMLALVMQDNQISVRGVFAAKAYKLVNYFNLRRSTHQLAAKYAAMLPLAAVDPELGNKEAAARMLREWVHSRRAAVQQSIMSARLLRAAPLPEEAAEDVECCNPFQYMLQFMLQPLLVESGSTARGAFVPALRKMCTYIKYTADRAEEPATSQLYVLCDMAAATIRALAQRMQLEPGLLTAKYPGGITLPVNFYRPLDKEERGATGVSFLPPGFEVELDPEPVAALAQPPHMQGQAAATAAAKHSRGTKPSGTAAAAAAATTSAGKAGRGSKRRAPGKAAGDGTVAEEGAGADEAQERPAKRSKGRGSAAAGGGAGRGSKARRAAKDDSDGGWESGGDDAPASAAKAQSDQLTSRQKQLQLQKQHVVQQPNQAPAALPASSAEGSAGSQSRSEAHSPAPPEMQQQQQQQQQQNGVARPSAANGHAAAGDAAARQPKQQQQQQVKRPQGGRRPQQPDLKQQQLSFRPPVHAEDASSPAPVRPRSKLPAAAAAAAAAAATEDDASADEEEAAGPVAAAAVQHSKQAAGRGAAAGKGRTAAGKAAGPAPAAAAAAGKGSPGLQRRGRSAGAKPAAAAAAADVSQSDGAADGHLQEDQTHHEDVSRKAAATKQARAAAGRKAAAAGKAGAVKKHGAAGVVAAKGGTVEQHVGGKICCLINELSEATEGDDLRQVQDRVDKIQAAVDSQFLEGLLQGQVALPLTAEVDMAEPGSGSSNSSSSSSSSIEQEAAALDDKPDAMRLQGVKCRGGCGEEFCSPGCEAEAWQRYHCLLCPVGTAAGPSGSSSSSSSIQQAAAMVMATAAAAAAAAAGMGLAPAAAADVRRSLQYSSTTRQYKQQVLVAAASNAQQCLQALQAAFLPFAVGHKAPWWDVVAEQQEAAEQHRDGSCGSDRDSEGVDAAELRAQLRQLAADSLALLRAGLQDGRFPQLFDLSCTAAWSACLR